MNKQHATGDLVFIRYSDTPLRDLNYFDPFWAADKNVQTLLENSAQVTTYPSLDVNTGATVLHVRQCPVSGYKDYSILLVLTTAGIGWVFDYEVS